MGENDQRNGRENEKIAYNHTTVIGYTPTPLEEVRLAFICVIVGIISGFAAVIFRWLVHTFRWIMWDGGRAAFDFLGDYYVMLIPMVGMFAVGLFLHVSLRKGEGHDVSEVMRAITLRGAKIPHHIAPVEAIASSLCIGSGGSVGPEGPMVQIGAGIGSSIGQILKLPPAKMIQVTAAGAAGGLAAIFNAPVAGVIFAMEAVLAKFHTKGFCYLVLASVAATQVYRAFLGNTPLLDMKDAVWGTWQELGIFVVLGVTGGIVASIFILSIEKMDLIFDHLKHIPPYLKPVIGGAVLGIFALVLPEVLGEGYETIDMALNMRFTLGMFALMLIFKIFATSLTLGSGGSGGVFAPALVFGAMLGGFFSLIARFLFPAIVGSHETYIAVGIASILASVFRAPITAIIMVVEISNNYNIVLPLMVASVSATYVSSIFFKGCSIYDINLVQEGIREVEPDLWFPKSFQPKSVG